LVEHKLIPKLMTILNRILDYYAQITSKMSWFNVRFVVLKMNQEKFKFPGCFRFPHFPGKFEFLQDPPTLCHCVFTFVGILQFCFNYKYDRQDGIDEVSRPAQYTQGPHCEPHLSF
jgi:hypothetical protein